MKTPNQWLGCLILASGLIGTSHGQLALFDTFDGTSQLGSLAPQSYINSANDPNVAGVISNNILTPGSLVLTLNYTDTAGLTGNVDRDAAFVTSSNGTTPFDFGPTLAGQRWKLEFTASMTGGTAVDKIYVGVTDTPTAVGGGQIDLAVQLAATAGDANTGGRGVKLKANDVTLADLTGATGIASRKYTVIVNETGPSPTFSWYVNDVLVGAENTAFPSFGTTSRYLIFNIFDRAFNLSDITKGIINDVNIELLSTIPVLTWAGDGTTNVWDSANTLWLQSGNPATYADGTITQFTDTGSNVPAINLAGPLVPSSVSVASANNYTFSGSGKISGSASITKSGAGSLTLLTDNDQDGPLSIGGGRVQVGDGGTTGNIGSSLSSVVFGAPGSVLAFNRSDALEVPVPVRGSGTNPANIEVNSGEVTLSGVGDNAFAAAVVASGGSLILAKDSSATIHSLGFGTNCLTVNAGGTARLGGFGNDQIFNNSGMTINGAFDMNGLSETIAALNGSGSIDQGVDSFSLLTVGNNNASGTYNGSISNTVGTMDLTKVGNGVQSFGGTIGISGITSVNAGTMQLLSGASSTSVTSVQTSATLQVVLTSSNGQASIASNLELNFDSTLSFNFDTFAPSTTVAPLSVTNLDVFGTEIGVTIAGSAITATGIYPLVTFTGSGPSDLSAFETPDLPIGIFGVLELTGQTISLNVTMIRDPEALTWTAATNTNWDNDLASLNWLNTVPAASPFFRDDSVSFDTTTFGGAITVDVLGTVKPGNILVSGADDVTISGGGSIVGPAGITKTGEGILTLETVNTFTGKSLFTGGTVSVFEAANLGGAPPAITADQFTINGATLSVTNGFTTPNNSGVVVGINGAEFDVISGILKIATVAGRLSGNGLITKNGSGTLATGGAQTGFTGKWLVNEGTLSSRTGDLEFGPVPVAPVPDAITLNGGILNLDDGGLNINVNRGITLGGNGGTLVASRNNGNITINPVISGTGHLTIEHGNQGIGAIVLTAANTYNGNTTLSEVGANPTKLTLTGVGGIASSPLITLGANSNFTVTGVTGGFVLGTGQTLEGTGTMTIGNSIATSLGTIAPGIGIGGTGTLTVGGTGTLDVNGNVNLDIDGQASDSLNSLGILDVTGATLNLNVISATEPIYVLARGTTLIGPFAAINGTIPVGYELRDDFLNGNGLALVNLSASGYFLWIYGFYPNGAPSLVGPHEDPDGDGYSNIVEFALGASLPNSPGSLPIMKRTVTDGHFTLTAPILTGATFTGSPSATASIQGITYVVGGSTDLNVFSTATEVTTLDDAGMPLAPDGYTYQTFRLVPTIAEAPTGFMRFAITGP